MKRCCFVTLVALLAMSACSDLRTIERDVCGNQVLEALEDCDTFSAFEEGTRCGEPATDNQCFYVCEDGASCPEGWGCGTDGRCRQAVGDFERAPGSPWRFNVKDFELGDADGDGNLNLIGNSESSIDIRFGTDSGEFPIDVTTTTPTPVGPSDFADLDGDGLIDIITPIFSGLFTMLGQPDRTLQSVAYAPFEIPTAVAVSLPVESNPMDPNTENVAFYGPVMELLSDGGGGVPLPEDAFVDDLAGRIPVANVDASADGNEDWAVAIAGSNRVYLFTVQGAGPGATPTLLREITLPGTILRGAMFADVDGNGRLDVMVSIEDGSGDHRVAVAYTSLLGDTDANAAIEPAFDSVSGVWPLTADDLNGDGKADYVGIDALYITDFTLPLVVGPPSSIVPLSFRTSTKPWSSSAIGDFNGDGNLDAAVGIDDTDGLKFFFGSGALFFNKFHLDTDGPASALRAGDFDGDVVTDLAFVQGGRDLVADELFVSYGQTSGGPGDPISMGSLGIIQQVEQTSRVVDIESLDSIVDLIVVSQSFPEAESTSVAIMVGSADRRMLSPYSLVKSEDDGAGTDTPLRVLVGNFVELAEEGIAALDVMALGLPQDQISDIGSAARRYDVWMLPGEGDAGGISSLNTVYTEMPTEDVFRSECSEWGVADLDGDGFDEIVGIDGNIECFGRGDSPTPRMLVASLGGMNSGGANFDTETITAGVSAVRKIKSVDLDNDGDLDIVAVFAGEAKVALGDSGPEGPAEGSAVVVFWNDRGAISASDHTSVQISGASRLFDFTVLNLDSDAIPELVVMTNEGIFATKLDADSAEYLEPRLLTRSTKPGVIDAGDVNGDGIDDITWTEGADVNVFLGIAAPPLGGSEAVPVANDEEGMGE